MNRRGFLGGLAAIFAVPFLKSNPEPEKLPDNLYLLDSGIEEKRTMTLYNLKTGEPSETLTNMVGQQLSKKFDDGTPVYTYIKEIAPELRHGSLKCYFCSKSNIPDKENLYLHMTNRHRKEYGELNA